MAHYFPSIPFHIGLLHSHGVKRNVKKKLYVVVFVKLIACEKTLS